MKHLRAIAAGGPLLVVAVVGALATATPAHAASVMCGKYDSTVVDNHYVVQNNVWGASTAQCVGVTTDGFAITTADHDNPTNGAPAAYPSIYDGCHYGDCSPGTNLPMAVDSSQFPGLRTSVSMSYPATGAWDASYDIWFDPTPRTTGQNTGEELMVWLNHQGGVQPVGSRVATVSIDGATWDVWYGNIGWNVVSYVRTSAATSADFAVDDFYTDTVNRGYAQRSWYLTSVQAGFEPWIGGAGLAVDSFSVTTGSTGSAGGGPTPSTGDTQPPTAPGAPVAGPVGSTGADLNWAAASDNVGVTGYRVYRQTSGGAFSQVATTTGTSYAATGLSPDTTYGFAVRAVDAAGNVSAPSPTTTLTTTAGTVTAPTGTAGCRVTYRVRDDWGTGFTTDVAISNTAGTAVNGWTLGFTFPGDQRETYAWNGTWSQSGQRIAVRDAGWNAVLAPGASTLIGFNGAYSGANPAPTAFTLNGTTCTTG